MTSAKFIATMIDEKDIDLEATFTVEGPSGANVIPYGVVVEHIATAPVHEQDKIAGVLRRIDFANGDVCHFLRHLGQAIAA